MNYGKTEVGRANSQTTNSAADECRFAGERSRHLQIVSASSVSFAPKTRALTTALSRLCPKAGSTKPQMIVIVTDLEKGTRAKVGCSALLAASGPENPCNQGDAVSSAIGALWLLLWQRQTFIFLIFLNSFCRWGYPPKMRQPIKSGILRFA